ncbi:MAG: hypothetical protein U0M13_13155, partial [Desulfovibrio fairfieldensis]|nr:hypothetical protein [Desulfovibrio fairfieldensis]
RRSQPGQAAGHGALTQTGSMAERHLPLRPRGWHGRNGVIKHVPSFTNFSAKTQREVTMLK